MRYWPMSVIATSPLLSSPYAVEVAEIARRIPSEAAFYACFEVARRTQSTPQTGLAIIESVDAAGRQVYIEYPCFDDWFRLERSAVVEAAGHYFIIIDALH